MKQTAEERAEARYKFVDEATNKRHDDFNDRQVERRIVYATCIREEVEPKEAEIERLRALVQILGNAIYDSDPMHHEDAHARYNDAIDALKEYGFVPTNTTEG